MPSVSYSVRPARRQISNINNAFITFNSALNFFVYCAFSRRFRLGLRHLVCNTCRLCRPILPLSSRHSNSVPGAAALQQQQAMPLELVGIGERRESPPTVGCCSARRAAGTKSDPGRYNNGGADGVPQRRTAVSAAGGAGRGKWYRRSTDSSTWRLSHESITIVDTTSE